MKGKFLRLLSIVVCVALVNSACSLKLSGPSEIFASCDRTFSYTVVMDNNAGEDLVDVICEATDLSNVMVDNATQQGISLSIGERRRVEFTGNVVNECGGGYFEVTCRGASGSLGRYSSNTLFVDVDHTVLIGSGPDGVTPDQSGRFESDEGGSNVPYYTTSWECCGNGGGSWKLSAEADSPSINVDSETLNQQATVRLRCPVQMHHDTRPAVPNTVRVRGKLTDRTQPGVVSILAKGDGAGPGDCRLLTPVEAAAQ